MTAVIVALGVIALAVWAANAYYHGQPRWTAEEVEEIKRRAHEQYVRFQKYIDHGDER